MVRTRYAPSPTGYMHIGNLRTALYEYLIAKGQGGVFVLRIEDTDRERYVEGALDAIFRILELHGLRFDEGPGTGGDFGPYVQSERLGSYLPLAKGLVEKGAAYYCFCGRERLAGLEDEKGHKKYDRACHGLPAGDVEARLAAGAPYVIRQLVPEGRTVFFDEVYGELSFDNKEIEDQVLIKSDGYPTYNFANVVDDSAMKITHVVRGSEYLSSTPKYRLLYDALGFGLPKFVHLPLLQNAQGQKISKRHGDASVLDLVESGFLPSAILNYAALLGWSPGGSREVFALDELAREFRVSGISKSPSAFDMAKLTWFNAEHIKLLPKEKFCEMAMPELQKAVKKEGAPLGRLAEMAQNRVSFLREVGGLFDFIDALPEYSPSLYVHKKMKTDQAVARAALESALPELLAAADFSPDGAAAALAAAAEKSGLTKAQVMWSVRTALSGKPQTPCGAAEICEILGKDESARRIAVGIGKLA